MKKSYKFLCILSSVVILLTCFSFAASAAMTEPYFYEWTGKEMFDAVKDKRFYFNSGSEYLSNSAQFISYYNGDPTLPIYGSSVPSDLYNNLGNSFCIFFSFFTLPEPVQIKNGDFVYYKVTTHMSNNKAFPIDNILLNFRGYGTASDGSQSLISMSDYFQDTYHWQEDNYAEMDTNMVNRFQWTGNDFLADTLIVMYYGDFATDSNWSTWRFGFRSNVELYAGDADNFPVDLDEHVAGADKITYNANLEAKIGEISSEGKAQAEAILKDFGLSISPGTSVFKGVTAVTKILNVGLQIPFLGDIIQFALSLGMFAFVVGMGFLYNQARNKKIREADRQERKAYYNSRSGKGGGS